MRIAYIYDAVYPWIKGGVEKRIYEIGKRLVKKGHEVHWFGLKWWKGSKDIVKEGIEIHGIGKWDNLYVGGRRSVIEGIYFGLKTLSMESYFDVIDCQNFPYFPCFSAKIVSLLKKSRMTLTWHEVWGDYWFEYLGKKGIFGLIVERLASKLPATHIAVSELTKKDLENLGVKNVNIIPNGIDFERIKKINPSKEKSDVIFAGRLIKDKNVDALIKALSIIKKETSDLKCLIIGEGPEKEKLISLTKKFKLEKNIEFKSFLSYDSFISYMKSSKVFVLPSTREGFGIAALEANACGLPVVTVRHERNATRYLIKKTGNLCTLDHENLAEKIKIGLEKYKSFRQVCINTAKRYDWENIVKKIEKIYLK